MALAQEVIQAPDQNAVRRLVERSSAAERRGAVEPLAEEVVRLLRVDARRAFEVAERAEMVADSTSDRLVRARSRWVMGHVLWGVSRIPEALSCYHDAARAYEELGRKNEVTRIAIGQVNALAWLGRYREALAVGEKARKALLRGGERAAAARMDLNLGNIHHWSGRPRQALARYDLALRYARRANDPAMTRMIQMNRGTQLSALGKLDQAEKIFRTVRDEAEREGERRNHAVADYNLGYILFQRGDYGAAYDTLDEARRTFEELGDDLYLTGTLIDLTELLIEVNDFRRASRLAAEARSLAERQGLRFETGRSTLLQAVSALAGGGFGEARALLEEARETFREDGHATAGALCELYLAEIATREGDPGLAVRGLRRAVAVFRREGMKLHASAAHLAHASVEVGRGRRKAARAALDEAGKLLRSVPSPWLRARLSHLRGRLAEADGQPGRAVRHFRTAVDRIESIRGRIGIDEFRVSFSEDKAPVYADLIRAILHHGGKGALAEAFSTVERARSRALVDLLAGRLRPAAQSSDRETRRLLDRMEKLRAEINRMSGFDDSPRGRRAGFRRAGANAARLRDREERMAETMRRLERRNAKFGALAVGETMTLPDAQRDLPKGTTLVEYFLGSRGSWAFVVRADEARVVELAVSADDVERRIAHVRFQIEKMGYGDGYARRRADLLRRGLARHLEYLTEKVWEPLAIPDGPVTIVPHGALHGLPFAALPLRDGSHVLDHGTVSYLPSASCRRYLARHDGGRAGRSPRLLAVEIGDRSIPEVRREVSEVRRIFPGGRVLRRGEATRARFQAAAREADVIHVATHGIFRGDEPGFSAVKLADGWMSLYDVYALRLNASLVCLSACQTGRNFVAPGDELVGLSRGFLYAGASALLVSLWPVPDGSTADLMTTFYRCLRRGLPADESLREAMRETRRALDHPFHWAPFVLIGGPAAPAGRRGDRIGPGKDVS